MGKIANHDGKVLEIIVRETAATYWIGQLIRWDNYGGKLDGTN